MDLGLGFGEWWIGDWDIIFLEIYWGYYIVSYCDVPNWEDEERGDMDMGMVGSYDSILGWTRTTVFVGILGGLDRWCGAVV